MEEFIWTENLVKDLLSYIHNNTEINMLFEGKVALQDSCTPVRDLILSEFKKLKSREPLFITEDGREIFESDFYWHVSPSTFDINRTLAVNRRYNIVESNTFSTWEAAKNYVIENKPCLSYNDILKWFNSHTDLRDFKNIVKRKLKL